jgi:hypothetical protein
MLGGCEGSGADVARKIPYKQSKYLRQRAFRDIGTVRSKGEQIFAGQKKVDYIV